MCFVFVGFVYRQNSAVNFLRVIGKAAYKIYPAQSDVYVFVFRQKFNGFVINQQGFIVLTFGFVRPSKKEIYLLKPFFGSGRIFYKKLAADFFRRFIIALGISGADLLYHLVLRGARGKTEQSFRPDKREEQ